MLTDLVWLNKTIEKMPRHNFLYKILCFFTFRRKRKFTYKEWYIILRNLNTSSQNDDNGSKFAFKQIVKIYEFNSEKTN